MGIACTLHGAPARPVKPSRQGKRPARSLKRAAGVMSRILGASQSRRRSRQVRLGVHDVDAVAGPICSHISPLSGSGRESIMLLLTGRFGHVKLENLSLSPARVVGVCDYVPWFTPYRVGVRVRACGLWFGVSFKRKSFFCSERCYNSDHVALFPCALRKAVEDGEPPCTLPCFIRFPVLTQLAGPY